jgi:CheY-like chemotaxis protein
MNMDTTILLADDNAELRAATREILEARGFRVLEAANGKEALDLLRQEPGRVDNLLSDVFMPVMGGLELVREALAFDPDLAVALCSSRSYDPDLMDRLGRGDLSFLAKPFSPEELLAALDSSSRRQAARVPEAVNNEATAATVRSSKVPRRALWGQLAALFVAALGIAWLGGQLSPPALPDAPTVSVNRGARLELLFPIGKLVAIPQDLRWREIEQAVLYRIEVSGVDREVIWRETTSSGRIALPAAFLTSLHAEVTYLWRVAALDSEGHEIAWSEQSRFLVTDANVSPFGSWPEPFQPADEDRAV